MDAWNEAPRLFIWTKSADEILAGVVAYCMRIPGAGHWVAGASDRSGGDFPDHP